MFTALSVINSDNSTIEHYIPRKGENRDMDKKKGGSWTKKYIENILAKYKSNDNCTPYAGFIIYRLKQRLQKFK